MLKFTVSAKGRLAKLVSEQGSLPYSAVRRLLRDKDVKVNGKRVKEDLICEIGDVIEVYTRPVAEVEASFTPIFCDANILACNKPAGITSEDFLLKVRRAFPSAMPVHRLDRNTRGVILYALNADAEAALLDGFKKRTFKKLYVAEVVGTPTPTSATLTAYLNKNAETGTVYVHKERQMGDVEIKTAYRVVSSKGEFSTLEVELLTGKTHQIRAHLAHIGHPIIGDEKYGNYAINRAFGEKHQRLQAFSITLSFKSGSPLYYLDGKEIFVQKEFGCP